MNRSEKALPSIPANQDEVIFTVDQNKVCNIKVEPAISWRGLGYLNEVERTYASR